MMPAARSVWRKGNEERHVLSVDDSFVSFVRFVDDGWGTGCWKIADWDAWASDAVQVYLPTEACIERDAKRRGGEPVIAGTRFPVAQLLAELAAGMDCGEFDNDFSYAAGTAAGVLRELAANIESLVKEQPEPQPVGETVRLTDAEIDRIAERLREKVFPMSVSELRVGNVSELAAMFDPPQFPPTNTVTVETPQ
jgi:hypothetical protein